MKSRARHTAGIAWYLKWSGSVVISTGTILTANNIYPLNLWFMLIGTLCWTGVALLWNDRSMMFLNTFALAVLGNQFVVHIVNFYKG